ncbi:hypothetical protein PVAP13_6NG238930 [Panicum virgatum]|uniref:Uncharacterized protein n=1 Tax=Panicum virgatum TaxID=38727 RepID=A0A8T0R1G4_PANVG|nr:hypothetical protein PVAP13_6NG238930 [Panicum virgatum]
MMCGGGPSRLYSVSAALARAAASDSARGRQWSLCSASPGWAPWTSTGTLLLPDVCACCSRKPLGGSNSRPEVPAAGRPPPRFFLLPPVPKAGSPCCLVLCFSWILPWFRKGSAAGVSTSSALSLLMKTPNQLPGGEVRPFPALPPLGLPPLKGCWMTMDGARMCLTWCRCQLEGRSLFPATFWASCLSQP